MTSANNNAPPPLLIRRCDFFPWIVKWIEKKVCIFGSYAKSWHKLDCVSQNFHECLWLRQQIRLLLKNFYNLSSFNDFWNLLNRTPAKNLGIQIIFRNRLTALMLLLCFIENLMDKDNVEIKSCCYICAFFHLAT